MTALAAFDRAGASPVAAGAVRLGYVLGAFPVLSETFVSGEVAAVARQGGLGAVFAFDPRAGAAAGIDPGIAAVLRPVVDLPPAGLPGLLSLARAVALTSGLPLRGRASVLRHAARIAGQARALGCTHLHAHFGGGAAVHGLVAARMAGLGFSLTLHSGTFARNFDGPAALTLLMRQADAVVGATAALATAARAEGARRVAAIACGADLGRFRPSVTRRHNRRLLSLGRLIDCKGVDTLLDALAKIDPVRRPGLDIVGEGPERDRLETLATAQGIDARFLGARENAWFAAEGGRYLGFVAPFRRGRDGQVDSGPVVLKEALALGLPVITSDLPGPAAIVGRAGCVVPADHPAALAVAIARLAAMTGDARLRLAAEARAQAEQFDIARQAGDLLRLVAGLSR